MLYYVDAKQSTRRYGMKWTEHISAQAGGESGEAKQNEIERENKAAAAAHFQ